MLDFQNSISLIPRNRMMIFSPSPFTEYIATEFIPLFLASVISVMVVILFVDFCLIIMVIMLRIMYLRIHTNSNNICIK